MATPPSLSWNDSIICWAVMAWVCRQCLPGSAGPSATRCSSLMRTWCKASKAALSPSSESSARKDSRGPSPSSICCLSSHGPRTMVFRWSIFVKWRQVTGTGMTSGPWARNSTSCSISSSTIAPSGADGSRNTFPGWSPRPITFSRRNPRPTCPLSRVRVPLPCLPPSRRVWGSATCGPLSAPTKRTWTGVAPTSSSSFSISSCFISPWDAASCASTRSLSCGRKSGRPVSTCLKPMR